MPAELVHTVSVRLQYLRYEKPQFPIAQYGYRASAGYLHLIQNLARGSKGLGKYRNLRGNRIGYHEQISFR
jgi:hypothetical protein